MKKESGFSLIELVIVLGLIALATGTATVYFGRINSRQQIATGREKLIQELNNARTEALARNTPVELVMTQTGVFNTRIVGGASVIKHPFSIVTNSNNNSVVIVFQNVDANRIVFDRLGRVSNMALGSTAFIWITYGGRVATINITAETGYVR